MSHEASTDLPKKELDEIIEKNKRAKGVDMRAYSLIQMSIPNEIFHGFKSFKTAKNLWDALVERYEGSEGVKENMRDLLKQEFELFTSSKGETLSQHFNRYVILIGELENANVRLENRT